MSNNCIRVNGENIEVKDNILDLSHKNIQDLSEVEGLDELPNLKVLSLHNNQITEIKGLEVLTNLQRLILFSNELTKIQGLDALANLQVLSLRANKITEIKGLKHLQNLREIDLAGNQINKINGLDRLNKLQFLDLSSNQISEIKGLNKLVNLKILVLSNNRITEIGRFSNKLSTLVQLILRNNEITEIKGLENLLNLQVLYLSSNKINRIGGLEALVNLKFLDLSNNQISRLEKLEKLENLIQLLLENNPLTGSDDFIYRTRNIRGIIEYIKNIEYREIPYIRNYNWDLGLKENVANFKESIKLLDDKFLVNIGTNRELKDHRQMQGLVFLEERPPIVRLTDKGSTFDEIEIHLMQIHSLEGMSTPDEEDKINYFKFFVSQFWDINGFEKNGVLIYNDFELNTSEKIDDFLLNSIQNTKKPNLIVFPENAIPKNMIGTLQEFSLKNKLIIIGGLEHNRKEENSDTYENQAIIIDNGKIGYQKKQTPTWIKNHDSFIKEGIECQKLLSITIFQTNIGRIAIFICKDFLRLSDRVSKWTEKNQVDLIVIPALTGKILPFHLHLHQIFNYKVFEKLRILFCNVGEYGGSELFSLKTKKRIEINYKRGVRDNIAERIVNRTIEEWHTKEEKSKILFGTDLKFENGDLVIEDGDLALVSGRPNLLQGIELHLLTKKGERKQHPELGSELYKINFDEQKENIEKRAEKYIREALVYESRIASIKDIKVHHLTDKRLNIIIELIPIDYPEPIVFNRTLNFDY